MMQLIFRSVLLLAFATALALTAGGAQAQSTGALMICSVMTTNAKSLMSIRQKGIPRETVDATVADDKAGPVKEFTKWMVDAAYRVEIQTSPSLVAYLTTEFQGLVYDQCVLEKW